MNGITSKRKIFLNSAFFRGEMGTYKERSMSKLSAKLEDKGA